MTFGQLRHADFCVDGLARTQSWRERNVGLLGKDSPPGGVGLLIDPCNAIHTIGMRYSISVIFLTRNWVVSRISHELPGWRFCMDFRAQRVLELVPGPIAEQFSTGMQLEWIDEHSP